MKSIKNIILGHLIFLSLVSYGQYGIPRQRSIIFDGNSLFNNVTNLNVAGGQYVPIRVYANLISSNIIAWQCYAKGGRTQTQINADIPNNIAPQVKTRDIIVLWEGTNDLNVNGLSAADAYSNLVTYANTVRAYGVKLVICTVIARDGGSDPGDLMTRIDSYNSLVRANASSICDAICDLAADPLFDTRADASNSTYYLADKVHQTTAGQEYVISLINISVNMVL